MPMAAARIDSSLVSCRIRVVRSELKGLRPCSMSMNGCGGGGGEKAAVCVREARTLRAVSAPEMAAAELKSAVEALVGDPPSSESGIIRLQVPIQQKATAIEWLHAQHHEDQQPRCFFSGRRRASESDAVNGNDSEDHLISAAGIGSAVFFRSPEPFELQAWKSIRRFLSEDCPLIRAYGAIRFDSRAVISPEWNEFGSFYFSVPLVEFDELEGCSILAANLAWDEGLNWTWKDAVEKLQSTIRQITRPKNFSNLFSGSDILSSHNQPNKAEWVATVNKLLKQIRSRDSELAKVVLARCTKFNTDRCSDPVTLLARLLVEGQESYQFCIQPPKAPAFIGNTPEQLFHRKYNTFTSEALAGTRRRGASANEDLQIGRDLLTSAKDHLEFTIVREAIKRKMELICDEVIVEPSKVLRKLPRVQHLHAELCGQLKSNASEFHILESLHPTPAVCGSPTEEARLFIENNETFDRGMYAGPVGWFGGRESEFAVGIRSALVGKCSNTLVYAGVGVVDGTDPFSEWEELNLKASQFAKLFQLAKSPAAQI